MPFCTSCGAVTSESERFCVACGNQVAVAPVDPRPVAMPGSMLRFRFRGDGAELCILYLKTFLLSLVTLGIYSFWGRTEIRKYMWNATEFEGHRFEWHGTGTELLMGALKIMGLVAVLAANVLLFALLFGEGTGAAIGQLVAYLIAAVLAPWAIVGTWRYRLSRTSFRGIRFSFRGTARELFPIYIKGLILTVFTLGICSPILFVDLRRYLCEHARYGNARFGFDGEGTQLIAPFVVSRIGVLFTFGISLLWYRVASFRYYWNHSTFQGARFRTNVSTGDMLLLGITNFLLVVFTLGIGLAWAQVRYNRYVLDHMLLDGFVNLDAVQQWAQGADATGETLTDFLDVEGFDLGL